MEENVAEQLVIGNTGVGKIVIEAPDEIELPYLYITGGAAGGKRIIDTRERL